MKSSKRFFEVGERVKPSSDLQDPRALRLPENGNVFTVAAERKVNSVVHGGDCLDREICDLGPQHKGCEPKRLQKIYLRGVIGEFDSAHFILT